jgi:AraC-like DNA-binding protein
MFLDILSLLVGFLCLFVMVLILLNNRANRKTNIYIVVILFIAGLQRFVNALEILDFTSKVYSPLKLRLSLAFFIVPIYYLFFRRLILVKPNTKTELLHFILPTVILIIDIVIFPFHVYNLFYLGFSLSYLVATLLLIYKMINTKNRSLLDEGYYKTIRSWTFLMLSITFSLFVFSNYFLFSENRSPNLLLNFYRFSSLLWLVALIYIFKNPILIFGEKVLLNSIKSNDPQRFLIWSQKPLKAIEEKDKLLYTNILNNIDTIVIHIQNLQKSPTALSTISFTPVTLSKELKVPKSHLELIFKYYCHYSVNDFSNLVKINYAIMLINDGHLEKYTIEHLGTACLFNSRFTFSKNFKKFIGVSVSDYLDNTREINTL